MTCYAVPAASAIIHYFFRKNSSKLKNNTQHEMHHLWLNLMLAGGGIFGLVDHLWNGELFLFGPNLALDLALGVTITLSIIIVWMIFVALSTPVNSESRVSS